MNKLIKEKLKIIKGKDWETFIWMLVLVLLILDILGILIKSVEINTFSFLMVISLILDIFGIYLAVKIINKSE